MPTWTQHLLKGGKLSREACVELLSAHASLLETAAEAAREVATANFGRKIYIRGLIEIGNCCRNDCFYCGIRRSNSHVQRYRIDQETILKCCRFGYEAGFRTFVLQGGEDTARLDQWVCDVVADIKQQFPDCAVTLSLGEKTTNVYQRFRQAGADRYLLRHETFDAVHYARLHPSAMSRDNRLRCLNDLHRLGFQTGTGFMVGSPHQTLENIADDILFLQEFRPEMIGIGPFLPHHDTPFAHFPAGNATLTLFLISLLRLLFPQALIPSTTALSTLLPDGRIRGILAGANVVMPNLSPQAFRAQYALYDNKAAFGAEAAEGLNKFKKELAAIGYEVAVGRGDFPQPISTK